ncbi:MAG: HlyD family efflux transporter periplasmic adaptor subunit [bacterium]|nr:HlyD family efflux transporter periplasmic adaptor subunit [bacterium]
MRLWLLRYWFSLRMVVLLRLISWTTVAVAGAAVVTVSFTVILLGVPEVSFVAEEQERTVELLVLGSLSPYQSPLTALGTVRSAQQVDIRAQTSGQVTFLPVRKGKKVEVGDVLVELEHGVSDGKVMQAEAALELELANLRKLQRGDRPEDVAILQQKLRSAQQKLQELQRGARTEEVDELETKLANARKSLEDTQRIFSSSERKSTQNLAADQAASITALRSASVAADTALSQHVQDIIYPIAIPANETCKLRFLTLSANRSNAESACFSALSSLEQLKRISAGIIARKTTEEVIGQMEQAAAYLSAIRTFLVDLMEVLNAAISMDEQMKNELKKELTTGQSTLEASASTFLNALQAFKSQLTDNSSAESEVNAKVTEAASKVLELEAQIFLKTAGGTQEQVAIHQSDIKQLELQIKLSREGARPEDISAQEAAVQRAQANLIVEVEGRNKAVLRAPISGTLIYLPVELGDVVNTYDVVAELANLDDMEVEVFLSEEQRRLINLGTDARVQGTTATGVVSSISPALDRDSKKIEVRISLTDKYQDLVVGESVFVEIQQDHTKPIRRIPVTAIKLKGEQAYVYAVDVNGFVSSRPVTLGRAFGERVELLDGLDEKDSIIPDIRGIEEGEKVLIQAD